jgi:hypothetical protein
MINKIPDIIALLRPGKEFSITNNDISTIQWNTTDVLPVTQEEIDNKIQELEDQEEAERLQKIEKVNSAISKLESLGLTVDEAKAVIGI